MIDPRAPEKGGIGNALEDVTRHYIDRQIADGVKGFMSALAKEMKTTKEKVFSTVDLFNPQYVRYAGMEVILAARLLRAQLGRVPASARNLSAYEHKVAEVCSYMQRTGFLLDREYAEKLSDRLTADELLNNERAAELGVENVNSTDQVADGLERMGVRIVERTPSGKRKVDKKLLDRLVGEENPLAIAVKEAKKAGKWRKTWVDTFLATADENDRCHASINTLQARTGRMSITGIPAQALPSGDWMIRRCFTADPGQVMASIDYQAQELRVLAALSGDKTMIRAFEEGADLHLVTARAAFGDHITKDDKERKYAKVVNFGRVYGGGAKVVAEQTGLDMATAKRVVSGFDKAYPGVKTYSDKLARLAGRQGYIETPIGRRLPVDPERSYSALNYMVQSTSRDVTCRGILRLHKAGFTPYLRLPIHDEVLASVPEAKAEWGAQKIAELMAETMGPVFIGTDPEVGGRSWGSLYGADY
ncbi:DNA polymerase [Pseudonocardia sp. DR1-2]|uniref:DNA polymerase A family protein n=1 Tax=Pseudonocardia sp. DR1-2 TaxID=2951168 RepID=UPI0020448206|nr:DNA polymerase A family protein [Pseudonocardia sp. DR1-2]MCM3846834.1 DNA polymerase [Pseudonocardia sp. DR1-2]